MCNNTIPIVKLSSWKIQDEWTKASSCSLWFLSSSGQAPQGVTNHPQIEVSGRRRRRSLWGEGGSYIPAKKIRWFYGINNAIYRSQTSWFMTFELDLKFGFTFFWIYCCCCSSAMLPALQVSCLMCFVPQLIERNLYADDRFIPTDWVGLPSLFSALYLVGRFLTPKKFLVNWETFFHHLKNL